MSCVSPLSVHLSSSTLCCVVNSTLRFLVSLSTAESLHFHLAKLNMINCLVSPPNASHFLSKWTHNARNPLSSSPLTKETSDDILSFIEVNSAIIAGFVNVSRPHYLPCKDVIDVSAVFLLASQSDHYPTAPPASIWRAVFKWSLDNSVFGALSSTYVGVYYSCGADKTLYEIITKWWVGAGGQSCADGAGVGCRKQIMAKRQTASYWLVVLSLTLKRHHEHLLWTEYGEASALSVRHHTSQNLKDKLTQKWVSLSSHSRADGRVMLSFESPQNICWVSRDKWLNNNIKLLHTVRPTWSKSSEAPRSQIDLKNLIYNLF